MNKKIYSFDVFDTCLTRAYAYPIDLFYDLAKLMLISEDSNFLNIKIDQLVTHRILAEKRTRKIQKRWREDICIDQIYNQFNELDQWKINRQYMLEKELELEQQSIRPILITKLKIEKLRKENQRIIFISDMYLPSQFIKECLINHGFAQNHDSVYVSGEIGLTKASGKLFNYLLEKEKCTPQNLHHTGDHPRSDFKTPRRLGISAELFEETKITNYEKTIAKIPTLPINIASQISAISRISRLNAVAQGADRTLAQLVTSVIAPLLTVFVAWILKDAHSKKIQRLYFVSRDGQIMYKIAKKIAEAYSSNIECKYLYGSRQAWFLPSLFDCNQESLDWLLFPHSSKSLDDILKRLDLSLLDVETLLKQHGFDTNNTHLQLNTIEINKFWQVIKDPKINHLIKDKATENREIALAYFAQEGLLEDDNWALVDCGWRLMCQRALKKIIQTSKPSKIIKGYYLGLRKDHVPLTEAGDCYAFISQTQGNAITQQDCNWFFQQGISFVVEEAFTTADHPPVMKYCYSNNQVEPVFKHAPLNPQLSSFTSKLHQMVLDYTDEIVKTDLLTNHLEACITASLQTTKQFFTNPASKDVSAIAWIPTHSEQTHDETLTRTLASPLSVKDIASLASYFFQPQNSRFIDPQHAWYIGSAALSTPFNKALFYTLFYTKLGLDKITGFRPVLK